ncbi:PaaI family thioesterase [Edaphobacter albus]|uniref:PaaI family thioesterase n=1 Tax=Edaphobacter sp. 4G125 TaxID=2763071 RepID=UPI0016496B0F|nr:PaaI family thioesterase [Edaphobacter sp. 4G125]QNI38211.1 PaaI family thioesterase [Edaphobacter sp. 4G125]
MSATDAARHVPAASLQGTLTIDERANHCFGCGSANPQGLHLAFSTDASDPQHPTAAANFQLDRAHEGPPGYVHGGIVATLLDEAMSKLNRPLDLLAVTRHMEIDYLRPVPLYQPLKVTSRHLRREGRKLFHQAEILSPDGTVLACGQAIFIVLDPAMLARAGFTQPEE